jgi:8-oxo-dGTP diphosphatase
MSLEGQRVDPGRYQLIPRTLIFGLRDGRVLLQQVPAARGAWAGLWNGVGGHVEAGESAETAARREFTEETGLTLKSAVLAGTLFVDVGTSPGVGVFIYVGEVAEGEPTRSTEGDLRWFEPGAVADLPTVGDLPVLLPRAIEALDGGRPFSAATSYSRDGEMTTRFDGPP